MGQLDGSPQLVDIGAGRRLRVARFGDDASERVLLFDPGSFGIYVDGYHLARLLAERGWYVIAQTRAGMYGSDPLPNGQAPTPGFHVADMRRLLDRLGIAVPIVLAGHSMAGVRLHLAGCTMPERLRGIAPLDAVCPSLMQGKRWAGWVAWARGVGQAGAYVADRTFGTIVDSFHPNTLQLEGQERADKLASIRSAGHLTTAAEEVAVTEKRLIEDRIEPARHLPAFYVTATPVSHGTTKLVEAHRNAGAWAERIKLPKEGHMSMLTPPAVLLIADGIEALWQAGG